MSRTNSDLVTYFNEFSWDVLKDYIDKYGVWLLVTDSSGTETLLDFDWYGIYDYDGNGLGVLYMVVYLSDSYTVEGIKIGNWKYLLSSSSQVGEGIYMMNIMLKVSSVEEENYS